MILEFNCNSIVFFNLKSTLKLDCVLGKINQDFNNPKQRCLTFIMHEMWLKIEGHALKKKDESLKFFSQMA